MIPNDFGIIKQAPNGSDLIALPFDKTLRSLDNMHVEEINAEYTDGKYWVSSSGVVSLSDDENMKAGEANIDKYDYVAIPLGSYTVDYSSRSMVYFVNKQTGVGTVGLNTSIRALAGTNTQMYFIADLTPYSDQVNLYARFSVVKDSNMPLLGFYEEN